MSKPKHHVRQSECSTRATYREGRKPKAVKVYTVNQESKYLLVQGVPAVGAGNDLAKLLSKYGDVVEHKALDNYPSEQFTEVYLVKYAQLYNARKAKRVLDNWSFYGGVLHVCYAPEYETVPETREKLQERRRSIAAKIRQHGNDGTYTSTGGTSLESQSHILPETNIHKQQPDRLEADKHSTHLPVQNYTNHNLPPSHSTASETHRIPQTEHMKLFQSEANFQETCYNQSDLNTAPWRPTGSQCQQTGPQSKNNFNRPHTFSETQVTTDRNYLYKNNEYQSTVREESSNSEEQIWLPPPPKQIKTGFTHQSHMKNYEFAKVPTAQAVFPVNFDARIDLNMSRSVDYDFESKTKQMDTESVAETDQSKTMQEKIEESLKQKDNLSVVVKEFSKKGPTPKFVPRQTQVKVKSTTKSKDSSDQDKKGQEVIESDELNVQIKRNAFTLGDKKGPTDIRPKEKRDPGEISVNKTVSEIRKKISKVQHT